MSWLDTVFKFVGYARYNTITPSLTTGQTSEWQCDANGRLLVNQQATNTVWTDAAASKSELVVKNGSGKIYKLLVSNSGGSTRYLYLFNATARPSNGATGELFVPIPLTAGAFQQITFERPRAFGTGLYWGVSSTHGTFTYDSGGTLLTSIEYE